MLEPTRRRVLLGLLALPFARLAAASPIDALSAKWLAWCETRDFRATDLPRG